MWIKVINNLKKYKEVINYLIFGVLTTVVNLVVYYGFTFFVLSVDDMFQLQVANVISWIISVAFAYVTNRKYVFESKSNDKVREICSFVGARLVTLFMDMVIMFVGVTILKGNDKLIKLISQVIVIISNYIFSKIFVFKN